MDPWKQERKIDEHGMKAEGIVDQNMLVLHHFGRNSHLTALQEHDTSTIMASKANRGKKESDDEEKKEAVNSETHCT